MTEQFAFSQKYMPDTEHPKKYRTIIIHQQKDNSILKLTQNYVKYILNLFQGKGNIRYVTFYQKLK